MEMVEEKRWVKVVRGRRYASNGGTTLRQAAPLDHCVPPRVSRGITDCSPLMEWPGGAIHQRTITT